METVIKEIAARQKEAAKKADVEIKGGGCNFLCDHECEICFTRGCGIESMNLICDDCQKALPSLLKSVGDLHPLRELFQCYQDAKESIEATGSTEWWLEKFVKTVDKLLE